MRLVRSIRWFVCALGGLGCAWAADPSPLRVAPNGRGLVDAGGRPVFLLADTAWSLALRVDRADAALYLRCRAEQRFNAVALVLFAPGRTELTGKLENAYGDAPFEVINGRPDPTKPVTTPGVNAAEPAQYDYWDHVDYLVALTRSFGLYAILLPTWGSGVVGSYDGKNAADVVFNVESARVYGAWLAQRYAAEPHVIWMMGGDRSAVNGDKDARPLIRAMAEAIAQHAPRQLISYHPRKLAPQSSAWFHEDAWLAFNSNQEWPENQIRCMADDWAKAPAKPTWLFEGRYEGYWKSNFKPGDWGEWQMRQQAYQTVFAGAFGHTYGHERVFGFGHDGANWKEFLDAPGARSMTHLAALMQRFTSDELLSRGPAPDLIEGDAGKAQRLRSNYVIATIPATRAKTMIYSANGRPISVRLEKLARAEQFAFWFNPRNGRWHREGAETAEPRWFARGIAGGTGSGAKEFSPPTHGDGEDWVLVLATSEKL